MPRNGVTLSELRVLGTEPVLSAHPLNSLSFEREGGEDYHVYFTGAD